MSVSHWCLVMTHILDISHELFHFSNPAEPANLHMTHIIGLIIFKLLLYQKIRMFRIFKKITLGSRRWNWKFRENFFLKSNPELLSHSSYSFWPKAIYQLQLLGLSKHATMNKLLKTSFLFFTFFMVAGFLSPNRCNLLIAKVKNYNLNVTEVLDSTLKKVFP